VISDDSDDDGDDSGRDDGKDGGDCHGIDADNDGNVGDDHKGDGIGDNALTITAATDSNNHRDDVENHIWQTTAEFFGKATDTSA
jgi:hypothetical protein